MDEGHAYEDLRPLLFSIAYRMVGSVSEAEDIVQEAFLRFHRTGSEPSWPSAFWRRSRRATPRGWSACSPRTW